jgi:hypothetical protein
MAFDSKHIGKRARCLTCGQICIIPSEDYKKPEKIKCQTESEQEEKVVLPGYYRAVFIDSWKLFLNPENTATVAFVIAVVCFKFFLARGVCCVNYISFIVIWGWLLGFYLNIIYETAFEIDQLPKIYLGTGITFLWYIIKPFLIFFSTMLVVQLPFLAAVFFFQKRGMAYEDIRQFDTGASYFVGVLYILGMFFFPMAILTTSVAKTFAFLRPGHIFTPIIKAFLPYLITVMLLVAAGYLEMQTRQYDYVTYTENAGRLALNLAVQVVAIIAMRSIGLFYRHYRCYLKW